MNKEGLMKYRKRNCERKRKTKALLEPGISLEERLWCDGCDETCS